LLIRDPTPATGIRSRVLTTPNACSPSQHAPSPRRYENFRLAQRNSEYGERIEHQSATSDVLKAMSTSPGNTQPVMDLITRRAAELCGSRAALYELRDGQIQMASNCGTAPELLATFRRYFPRSPDRSLVVGRAILDRQVIHVPEVAADPLLSQATRDLGGT